MKTPETHIFEVEIKNRVINEFKTYETGLAIKRLSSPLTDSNFKIYVLCKKSNIVYIGTTGRNIRTRLRGGIKAMKYFYKWCDIPKLRLFVWCFDELEQEQIENIEAELAFLVRLKTDKWPKHQNEIHFNNNYGNNGKKIALELYDIIKITNK